MGWIYGAGFSSIVSVMGITPVAINISSTWTGSYRPIATGGAATPGNNVSLKTGA